MSFRIQMSLWSLLVTAACAPVEGADSELALEAAPLALEAGSLALGSSVGAVLSRQAPAYAWEFTLPAPAQITLWTAAGADGLEVDTLLSLQRRSKSGWGRVFARSDDRADSRFSQLTRALEAGRYRVVVRGFQRRTSGEFALHSSCAGAGCPAEPPTCLFGSTYRALRDSAAFAIEAQEQLTEADAPALSEAAVAQLLAAVRVAYSEAHDALSAFRSVDQGEVNRIVLRELEGERSFVVYEYGAGDNSYGAVFAAEAAELAAEIHDGDLYACAVFGTPRGAREGAECHPDWEVACDEGLTCREPAEGEWAGRCEP